MNKLYDKLLGGTVTNLWGLIKVAPLLIVGFFVCLIVGSVIYIVDVYQHPEDSKDLEYI